MKNPFQSLMSEATRLTRDGRLSEAAVVIQRALTGASEPKKSSGATQEAPHAPAAPGESVDQEMREISVAPAYSAGVTRLPEQVIWGTFGNGTRKRDYRLFIPERQLDQPLPLVLMLHGCTQDAEDFAKGTAMDEHGRRSNFMVLYPQQSGRLNQQKCWNWFKHNHQKRDSGEPGLLHSLTGTIIEQQNADRGRVYVAGMSAGGAMAAVLGNLYPELFAAIAVHSGLAAGVASDLPSALAIMRSGRAVNSAGLSRLPRAIVLHGDGDKVVHPANAELITQACLQGIALPPRAVCIEGSDNGRRWSLTRYSDKHDLPLAEHWQIHGAAHAWSGGNPAGSYTDAAGPDASALIAQFFRLNA